VSSWGTKTGGSCCRLRTRPQTLQMLRHLTEKNLKPFLALSRSRRAALAVRRPRARGMRGADSAVDQPAIRGQALHGRGVAGEVDAAVGEGEAVVRISSDRLAASRRRMTCSAASHFRLCNAEPPKAPVMQRRKRRPKWLSVMNDHALAWAALNVESRHHEWDVIDTRSHQLAKRGEEQNSHCDNAPEPILRSLRCWFKLSTREPCSQPDTACVKNENSVMCSAKKCSGRSAWSFVTPITGLIPE